ncbi:MAG: hypothetical protein ACOCQ4_02850 [bacterium]
MTEREIRKYIDRLNKGNACESIFTRQISNNVVVSKVWSNPPKVTDDIIGIYNSYRFFFIKNEQNIYIAAVLDMNHDLHWYVSPSHRKKGYLTNALKESILPYLFNEEREAQRITIRKNIIGEKNYLGSKTVAQNLGFKATNEEETEFELTSLDFNWENENLKEINSGINSERLEVLRKRVFYAYKILYKISDELTMAYNDDKELNEVAQKVKKYTMKIEDIEWENKKTKR